METQVCPQCNTENEIGFRFCRRCGATLAVEATPTHSTEAVSKPTHPSLRRPPAQQSIGQMGAGGRAMLSIWHPFAGYGQRGRHVSWLLDNLGERAEALRDAVSDRFLRRRIPGAWVEMRTLSGRGIAVERRPYYLVQRGIATVGLYIARLGQDLYISQVTYAKGPVSPLRVLVLTTMALLLILQVTLPFFYLGDMLSDSQSVLAELFDVVLAFLGVILCCMGPLAILNPTALFLATLHITYKTFTDRDPLALLRTPPNEFEQDDIIALEKTVEETVRQSLDSIGIDTALMPPATAYGIKRRLI